MQWMNGDVAAREIKKLVKIENQKSNQSKELVCNIVACSANTAITVKQCALQSGMVDFEQKPLYYEAVQKMMDKWFFDTDKIHDFIA